jgi:hypothetical protein
MPMPNRSSDGVDQADAVSWVKGFPMDRAACQRRTAQFFIRSMIARSAALETEESG